ncbi:MAG: hypothetical protein FWG50_10615 [Kiritimatiellaeota bacterium]|nr:hypothetical protein [Kiritimatiellota bacterium]
MKKAVFGIAALIVMLAAIAIVSCNMGVDTEPDEEPGITLNISGRGDLGRALTGPTAEAGTTFYEASFKNLAGPTYIRTFWNWNTVGRIQLLPGTYEMILFAGRGSDRTLLGVGRVTAITNSDSTTTSVTPGDPFGITPATRGLTLTLQPLVTDVGGSYIPGDSSFIVTENSVDEPTNDPIAYTLYDQVYQLGDEVPLFHLKKNSTAEVQWHFAVGSFSFNDLADYANDIIVTDGAVIHNAGFMMQDSVEQPIKLGAATKYISPDAGDPIDPSTGFVFELGVPNNDGLAQIAIEVPVVAYNNTNSNPQTWWIRGGLNNGLLDVGADPTTGTSSSSIIGGAIVVGFGELSNIPTITITPDTGWGLGTGGRTLVPATDRAIVLASPVANGFAMPTTFDGGFSPVNYDLTSFTWAPGGTASTGVLQTATIVLTINATGDTNNRSFVGATTANFTVETSTSQTVAVTNAVVSGVDDSVLTITATITP